MFQLLQQSDPHMEYRPSCRTILHRGSSSPQKTIFPPICTCRLATFPVPENVPAAADEMFAAGFAKLGWLRTLKASNRSRRLLLSHSFVFFSRLRSTLVSFGPVSRLRRAVPKVNGA